MNPNGTDDIWETQSCSFGENPAISAEMAARLAIRPANGIRMPLDLSRLNEYVQRMPQM